MSLPGWALADAVGAFQGVIAATEAVSTLYPVDPDKAAAFALAVATAAAPSLAKPAPTLTVSGFAPAAAALYNAVSLCLSPATGVDASLPKGIFALARGLAGMMDARDAAAAFAALADGEPDPAPAPEGATPNRVADIANAAAIARLARMAWLAAYAQALTATDFAVRSDAITARADCAVRFDRELDLCVGGPDLGVAATLTRLRDRCIDYLSQAVVNSKPVLTVDSPMELPSVVVAWTLYGDPSRIDDLVARNGVAVPEFMPRVFEALAA